MTDATATGKPAKMAQTRTFRLGQGWFAFLLIAPAMIFIAVIVAWPLFETFRLSFTDARLGGENYVGLANYSKLAGTAASSWCWGLSGRFCLTRRCRARRFSGCW